MFPKLSKEEKQVIIIAGLMVTLLIVLPQVSHGQEMFLREDESMVCKHERHLGTVDSNQLVCRTFQDDEMPYDIFERLMIDDDTYPLD